MIEEARKALSVAVLVPQLQRKIWKHDVNKEELLLGECRLEPWVFLICASLTVKGHFSAE